MDGEYFLATLAEKTLKSKNKVCVDKIAIYE